MRVERVGLKHHGDAAFGGRQKRNILAADLDQAIAHLFKASNHAQQRGFTAAGGADKHAKFTIFNIEINATNDFYAAKRFFDAAQCKTGHSFPPICYTPLKA